MNAPSRPPEDLNQRESRTRGRSRRITASFTRAIGSVLVDVDGKRHLDFIAGGGTLNYGHNDADMSAALLAHLQDNGLGAGLDVHSTAKEAFLRAFCGLVLAPRGMSHRVQFTGPSGHDALQSALRLARRITGRHTVIAFTHGEPVPLDHPLSDAWRHPYDGAFGPDVDTAAQLAALLSDPVSGVPQPAAIVVEPVAMGAELQRARPEWLRRIAAVAQAHGALLVMDDRHTGAGRLGPFFGFEGAGLMPDLVLPSESLGGLGLPLSVLLVRPDRDLWSATDGRGNFLHNHHAFVTGAVACEKFWSDDRLQRQVHQRGELMRAALEVSASLVPGTRVLGSGLLRALQFESAALAERVMERCRERGLLADVGGIDGRQLRLMPPVNVPTLVLEQGLAVLHRSLSEANGHKSDSAAHRQARRALRAVLQAGQRDDATLPG